MEWRDADGLRWLEAQLPGARAAFSTRFGGASDAPYDSLNIALKTGDDPERVRANRHALAGALGLDPAGIVMARQVHGGDLVWHKGPQEPPVYADAVPSPIEADAHATGSRGLTPLVMTADCLPVAVAGPGGVAMAHGGWRGLAAGIVGTAAERVGATAAAIGPGIGPCCYEVGSEVLAACSDLGDVAAGRMLDLTAVARALLERAGVGCVEAAGLCTSCNPELFYSHRRDGERTGRQAGLAWLDPGAPAGPA